MGIVEDVEQHLTQPHGIADEKFVLQPYNAHLIVLIFRIEQRHHHGTDIPDHIWQRIRFIGQNHLSAFDFGKIEHVVDKAEQLAG